MLPLRISNLLATFFKIFLEKESRRMEKGKIFFLLAKFFFLLAKFFFLLAKSAL